MAAFPFENLADTPSASSGGLEPSYSAAISRKGAPQTGAAGRCPSLGSAAAEDIPTRGTALRSCRRRPQALFATPHDVDAHVGERVAEAHAAVHAPAEVLVEGRSAAEHLAHVCDAIDCPTSYVLVEGRA